MQHVFVGSTELTLPCASASLCFTDRQTEREEQKRWVEEGKQLFEVKEQTAELVDQGKTCFHWSEHIHKGAVKYSGRFRQ